MMSKNGLHLITPTSVDKTGTGSTATINANGSVTFSSCDTLSLNGVFSADYDNYLIVCRMTGTTGGSTMLARMRLSGTDNSTSSSYTFQRLGASSTTVSGSRVSDTYTEITLLSNVQRAGFILNIYGPYLAQPTAGRTITIADASSGRLEDRAFTHNQSTAYDGITIYPNTGYLFSGLIAVYGLRN